MVHLGTLWAFFVPRLVEHLHEVAVERPEAVRLGVFEIFSTVDGYFGINSDDGLGLGTGSYSDVVDRINTELVETSINDDGYLVFETDERLGLVFGMDDEGNLVVDYREET